MGGDCDENCVVDERRLCYECVEGMHATLAACAACDGARRCLDNVTHLLCQDGFVLGSDGVCARSSEQNALIVENNHAVMCAESHVADGTTCTECPLSCVSCVNEESCQVCAAGTSLSPDGACVVLENATAQAHTGAVACDEAFFVSDTVCASCIDRFSDVCLSCGVCSGDGCVRCDGDVVFSNGAWRESPNCAVADGTVCLECADGATRFNATHCVPDGDCSVYVDGVCAACRQGRVLLPDGSCVDPGDCTAHNGGACLRCVPGMYADEAGVCKCLARSFQLTRSV